MGKNVSRPKSTYDLKSIYMENFAFNFDVLPDRNFRNVLKFLKKLIEEQGYDAAEKLVVFTLSNWNKIKRECKITGYPTVNVLYGYRYSLMDLMKNPSNRSNSVEYRSDKPKTNSGKKETNKGFNIKSAYLNS